MRPKQVLQVRDVQLRQIVLFIFIYLFINKKELHYT